MNGKDSQSQHGKTKPDDKPMDGPNPNHAPTSAQSPDNRPTGTPFYFGFGLRYRCSFSVCFLALGHQLV
jgi:hypothetical protein